MQRTLLALALIATAGVSYAQTHARAASPRSLRPSAGRPQRLGAPARRPAWPGQRCRWRCDERQHGDGTALAADGAAAADGADGRPRRGPRQATFKDEFGFRYDSEGNRLDARGNIISPQTR